MTVDEKTEPRTREDPLAAARGIRNALIIEAILFFPVVLGFYAFGVAVGWWRW